MLLHIGLPWSVSSEDVLLAGVVLLVLVSARSFGLLRGTTKSPSAPASVAVSPPGPRGWPIVGVTSAVLSCSNPASLFHEWSQQYNCELIQVPTLGRCDIVIKYDSLSNQGIVADLDAFAPTAQREWPMIFWRGELLGTLHVRCVYFKYKTPFKRG